MRRTIDTLCGFARRASCSDAERRASLQLHDDLRAGGHEAWVETYWVRPKWATSLLLHAALGVGASLAATAEPIPALAVALVAALSYALEAYGRGGLLRLLFFRRATQVVVVEAADPERIALLITANVDAPRQGLVFRDGLRRLGARLGRGPIPSARGWVILGLLGVAAAAGARIAGAEGPAVGGPQFAPTLLLLLIAAAALDASLSGTSPGASDDAAGVAVAVALHAALVEAPPQHLSASLALAGAGEMFPLGLGAHLRRERPAPAATVVLEIGPCGAGAPGYATRHHQLLAACDWTRAELPQLEARRVRLRRPSAAQAARVRGIPVVTVRGVDDAGIPPRSRTAQDTPERIDEDALRATLEFCRAMVDVLDADLGVQPD